MKKQLILSMAVAIFLTLTSICHAQSNGIQDKRKTLPEGVTKEWLNTLNDENGNKIALEDTTGDAFQTRNFTGFNSGDEFGLSVASAGDVNGDGYSDIIIGAPLNSNLYSYGGRAYIYYGGLNVNTIPDVILSANAPNLFFGGSVSSAGDVNGDGYSDVVVSATGFNNSGGVVMIYFGGASMNNVAELTITGDNEYDQFGISVSTAGDVNGDGYSDVIIGANGYNSSTGRASICLGGANMDPTPDILLTGDTTGSNFGNSVSSAGDVNNDGFGDVIVGASTHGGYTGSAYIFYGGANMNNVKDKSFFGQNANDNFGTSVASAGDINGDSYSDVLISATGFNGSTGIVYLYLGSSDMDNNSDVTMNGENLYDYFGSSVSTAGDMNGDGYPDILIGAPNNNSKGKVYIYYGGINMNNVSDMTLSGETANSHYGNNTAFAGDMNGDGFPDLLVGAWGHNFNTGKVYLYIEGMTGTQFPNVVMTGGAMNDLFGESVSTAGDVNGDGYQDIIVGSHYTSGSLGKAYIFFGGQNMDNIADVIFTGASVGTNFGQDVKSAGDVNGDGFSDVIIGAYGYNTKTGRAYLYYGGSAMNNIPDVIMTGEAIDSYFGYSVSTAGDLNADGYSDIVVGAYGYPYPSLTGRAYIYFGGSSMDNIPDHILSGDTVAGRYGYSVSTAGDINGDGYSDLMISSEGYSISKGRIHIYYGSSSFETFWDVQIKGENSNYHFGKVISSAGDLNGDGYSDIIVGTEAGRAYLYFGGYNMNTVSDLTLTSNSCCYYFGESVSGAGDVNGDGYSDVIVGEKGSLSYNGNAYVFYGGISMNNTPDIIMSGEGGGGFFGASASTAGDVNGDGSADIVVGAYNYDISKGRAYVYSSGNPNVNPNLVSIKDVPNDQGGFVKLKWVKSAFDIPVSGTVTGYLIERSVPPGASGFQWEQIGTVLPTQNNQYYYFTSSTPSDSGISGNSSYFFRITAYTGTSNTLYRSNNISGTSIDNIAPAQVYAFSANPFSNNVRLSWNRNHDPDLRNYVLYRSTSPVINISTEPIFATVNDSTYLDTAPLTGVYYYFIVAQDIHSNKSPVVSSESQNITINSTAFIEGFFDPNSNTQVSDTIKTYLRNAAAPYAIVDSSKAVLNANGSAELKFGNAATGNYYIVFHHRNSIETWSKNGGESLTRGAAVSYNLTNAVTQAFGSNTILKGTKYCIYSGDVNQDGLVDLTDGSMIDNDSYNFVSDYEITDLTGDNFVDLTDLAIADNNAFNFVSVVAP